LLNFAGKSTTSINSNMAEIEIRLPKMGESVTEATITNWLKNIGDAVAMDEPLVEVATDKVDNELPSEAAGTLIKILFEKDQVAQVGDVIAILSTDGEAAAPAPVAASAAPAPVAVAEANATPESAAPASAPVAKSTDGRFYSPLVRTIALKENVSAHGEQKYCPCKCSCFDANTSSPNQHSSGCYLDSNQRTCRDPEQRRRNHRDGPHAQAHRRTYGDVCACFSARNLLCGG